MKRSQPVLPATVKPSPYHNPGDAFGVYVHWPFCQAKCPYCDFNSHVRHKPVDQAVFVEAYLRELHYMAELAPDRLVSSIFFGGGTPSLMEPSTVDTILRAINSHWNIANDCEITLEANPTSVEAGRFRGYYAAGVNRVSLGVQSLDDQQLKFLGRLHSADEAKRAIGLAREIFPRLSFDLIYARPQQQEPDWERELNAAIDLAADHLSLYQLTIEQGTPFFDLHRKGKFQIPDQERAARLYEQTQAITSARGLPAYEISNHAAKGQGSRHNLVYWRYQDYAGIGPGAHGRLSVDGKKLATANQMNPEIWWQKVMVDGHGMVDREVLTHGDCADEMLLMGLRLREGIDPERYAKMAGQALDAQRVNYLLKDYLIEISPEGRLRATPSGFLVLDALVADLGSGPIN